MTDTNDGGALSQVPEVSKEEKELLATECVQTLKKSLVKHQTRVRGDKKALDYWALPIGSMSTVWDLFEHRGSLSVLKDILAKALGERIKTAQTTQMDSKRVDNLSLTEKRQAAEKWVKALGNITLSAVQQQQKELSSLKASVIALKEAKEAHKAALEALESDPGNLDLQKEAKVSDATVLAATAALMEQTE